MAERQGFEPWVEFYPHNRLAGGCLQPTRPPLPKQNIVPVQFFFVKESVLIAGLYPFRITRNSTPVFQSHIN
jgi:hypothetical protein